MFKKKKKEEKEPNIKFSLSAAILLLLLVLFCFIDTLRNLSGEAPVIIISMSFLLGACLLIILWGIWQIVKRLK